MLLNFTRVRFALFFIGFILIHFAANSQNNFRSTATGNWNAPATWEEFVGGVWVAATTAPTSGSGTITIQDTHDVTVTAPVSVDQVTVATGGQLTINPGQTLTIVNGGGTDMSVSGTVVNHGTITITGGTLAFNAGGVYKHNQTGGTIPAATWNANSTIEFSNGGTTTITISGNIGDVKLLVTANTSVNISGPATTQEFGISNGTGTDLQVDAGSALLFNSNYEQLSLNANASAVINGTLTLFNEYVTNLGGTTTIVNGTLVHGEGANLSDFTAAKLTISSSGTLDHARNNSTVPTATWSAGSTLILSGLTDAYPAGMAQNFHHVLFQSALTADVGMSSSLTVLGNLTISNTGGPANELQVVNTGVDRTVAVTGNFLMNTAGSAMALVASTGAGTMTVGGNFTVSAGTFIAKNGNGTALITVAGNMNVSGGTFSQHLSGTGTSTVNVTGNFSLSSGTFNMSSTDGATGTFNLSGNYSHTGGTLSESGGTTSNGQFNFTGDRQHVFASTVTVTDSINYTVETGDTLQFNLLSTLMTGNGAFITLPGSTVGIRHPQGITTAVSGATGAVRTTIRSYNTAANYIYNGSTVQATGNGLTGAANLTIANTGAANVTMTNNNVAVSGNVLISSGTLVLGTQNIFVGGNWTNNSTATGFSATGTGNVVLNGAGLQTIGGTAVTNFQNLNLTKITGTVLLAQDVNVNGSLNIGVNLDLSTHILTMGAASPAIGTQGAGSFSASKMIIADGGGELRKNLTSAPALGVAFPIGDNTGTPEYSPAALTLSGGTYAGYVAVKVTDDKHPNYFNPTDFISRYWTVSQSGLTGVSYGVGFTYVDADIVGIEANILLGQWIGAEPWIRFPASIIPGSNSVGVLTGLSVLGDFTGISALAALPVKLSSITVAKSGNAAELKWATSEEINSSHYEVEHSTDGRTFSTVGNVQSKNSLTGSTYSYIHSGVASGKNFYRLKMVDIDGRFEYSEIVSLNMNGSLKLLSVYPNPATNTITVQYEKAVKGAILRIVNMEGQLLKSLAVPTGSTQIQMNLSGLVPGAYNLIYNNNGGQTVQRIQKQ